VLGHHANAEMSVDYNLVEPLHTAVASWGAIFFRTTPLPFPGTFDAHRLSMQAQATGELLDRW
jgi:hypothetical protein